MSNMSKEVKAVVVNNNLDGPYVFYAFKDGQFQRVTHDVTASEISAVKRDIQEISRMYINENKDALKERGLKGGETVA